MVKSTKAAELDTGSEKVLDFSSALLAVTSKSISISGGIVSLWNEHVEIRRFLDDISKAQKLVPKKPGEPTNDDLEYPENKNTHKDDSRDAALENFVKWAEKKAGISLQGVTVGRFDEFGGGYGIKALEEMNAEKEIIFVPRRSILSFDNARKSKILKDGTERDPILKGMHNVTLALFLLCEKLKGPDSYWSPYIEFLPLSHETPLYFTDEELDLLKGSPVFEDALRLFRNVARQYAYFLHLMGNKATNPLRKTPLTLKNFTFSAYRWAVGTATTRMNLVPSELDPEMKVPALLPFIDLANHRHGLLTTDFNDTENGAVCRAQTQFKEGDQVFIYYGSRSQGEYLLHDGFVAEPGFSQDFLTIKLGLSRNDKLFAGRTIILAAFGLKPTDEFRLTMILEGLERRELVAAVEERILHFVRVFVSSPEQIAAALEKKTEIQELHKIFCHNVETEQKAWSFLKTRFRLLLRGYRIDSFQDPEPETTKKNASSKSSTAAEKEAEETNADSGSCSPTYSPKHTALIRALVSAEKGVLNAGIELAERKLSELE